MRVGAVREGVGEEPGDGAGAGHAQRGTATRVPRHQDDRGEIEKQRSELGAGREVDIAQDRHGDEPGHHNDPRRLSSEPGGQASAERTVDTYPHERRSVGR